MWIKVIERLFWAVLGAVLGAFLSPVVSATLENLKGPEATLAEARRHQALMTPESLNLALSSYESLLEDPKLKLDAMRGMSRAHADYATLNYWRGLPITDHSEHALNFAMSALAISPPSPENTRALAYAYDCRELSDGDKEVAKSKVQELIAQGHDDLEVKYLAWLVELDDASAQFFSEVDPGSIHSFRILFDGAMDLIFRAMAESDAGQREMLLGRAQRFLERAQALSPDHGMVYFGFGYRASVAGNQVESRDFFARAIEEMPRFPKARNNLGYAYAAQGQFHEAEEQFQAAIDGTAATLWLRLRNLAYTRLEVGKPEAFCDGVQQAGNLPEMKPHYALYDKALCSAARADWSQADAEYEEAAAAAAENDLDFWDLSTMKGWNAGPEELRLAQDLISHRYGRHETGEITDVYATPRF